MSPAVDSHSVCKRRSVPPPPGGGTFRTSVTRSFVRAEDRTGRVRKKHGRDITCRHQSRRRSGYGACRHTAQHPDSNPGCVKQRFLLQGVFLNMCLPQKTVYVLVYFSNEDGLIFQACHTHKLSSSVYEFEARPCFRSPLPSPPPAHCLAVCVWVRVCVQQLCYQHQNGLLCGRQKHEGSFVCQFLTRFEI